MTHNVALIVLDCVRADYFAEYAPRLQKRADAIFTQCRAASSWSVPSHGSMMTGMLPSEHGVHTHNKSYGRLSRSDSFLRGLPHTAIGVSANAYVSNSFDFDVFLDSLTEVSHKQYFSGALDMGDWMTQNEVSGGRRYLALLRDAAESDSPLKSLGNAGYFKINDLLQTSRFPTPMDGGATLVCNQIEEELTDGSEPLFLLANIMESHAPLHTNIHYDDSLYDTPRTWSSFEKTPWDINTKDELDEDDEEYIECYREVYRASIEYLDRRVLDLVDSIQSRTENETTVIVTADHGENLAHEDEDQMFGHSSSMSEGLLHVPFLIFNAPNWLNAQYDQLFSHLDLGRLIRNIVTGETEVPRRDLVPAELVGSGVGNPEEVTSSEKWEKMIRVVYGDERYVWDSIDGAAEIPNEVRKLFDTPIREYKEKAKEGETDVTISESTEERLRELGYL